MSAEPNTSAAGHANGNVPDLSVVVPVHNEAENIRPLIEEIVAALDSGPSFEIIYVDDGSRDHSREVLATLCREIPSLRALRHETQGGQSAAIRTGVAQAQAPLIATLDGDGQNDPADIGTLIQAYHEQAGAGGGKVMIAGWRTGRRDNWIKRLSSKIANAVRSRLLGDATPDTGCGLKVFRRDDFMDFPAFDHMHRFLPALMQRSGGRVISVAVNHRPRTKGQSNYGLFDRLWVGIADLRGVGWLKRRAINPTALPIEGETKPAQTDSTD